MTIKVPMCVLRTSDDLDPKPDVRYVTLVVDHDAERPSAYRGEFTLKGLTVKELAAVKRGKAIEVSIG